jgi:hypothetical protein
MPCWVAKLAPELLSAGAPMPGGGRTSAWGLLNLARGALYWLGVARAVGAAGISEAEDAWRRESLGLGPVQTAARLDDLDFTPQLLCVSRLLFPKPLDYPRHAFQVGFLQTDGGDSQGLAQHEDDLSESEGSPPRSSAAASGTPAQLQRDAVAAAAITTPSSGSPGGGPPSNGAGAMPSPPLTPATVARQRVVVGGSGGGSGGGGSRRIAHELRAFMDRPDPELRRRLPLAVVTFGSMTNSQRPRLVRDIVRVLYERGMRVLVLAGWRDCAATRAEVASLMHSGGDEMPAAPEAAAAAGGSPGRAAASSAAAAAPGGGGGSELNGRVFVWDEAPHEYVFPNGLFVVHHGGAGTTARALSCGVPSVVIPVLRWADQSLYGELVERLGVGVLVRDEGAPIAAIRRAVEAVLAGPRAGEPRVAHNSGSVMGDLANRVGSLVRAERAADTALALLESCLCRAVLGAAEAEEIRPRLAGAGARGAALRPLPEWAALSKAQRMCVRHCVVCRRVRAEACVADVGAASDGAASLAAAAKAAAAAVASPAASTTAAALAAAGATPGFASPPQGAAALELAGATPAAVRRRRKGSA